MRFCGLLIPIFVLCLAVSAHGFDVEALKISEGLTAAEDADCYVQYYYHIGCPTSSMYWSFSGWSCGDKIGEFFTIGDVSTCSCPGPACDSARCQVVTGFKVLDFAGYGQTYPGLYTVRFDIYCSDESGCPVGGSLWESPPLETAYGWNTISVDPPLDVAGCCIQPDPPARPRLLVTATHIGTACNYPKWGLDNISAAVLGGCDMHTSSCLPALYPRPSNSHYSTIHSGYYGINFANCPPWWFVDGGDTTHDQSMYGFIELAWRLCVRCVGDATEPTTWGNIKAIYK